MKRQIEQARKGIVTDQIKIVAEQESADTLMELSAGG